MTATCQVPDCDNPVSREGFELCYQCWKKRDTLQKVDGVWGRLEPGERLTPTTTPPAQASDAPLSSTKIGKAIGISNQRVNLLLAELGWIDKHVKGWKVTAQGEKVGGTTRTSNKGVPYVVWPHGILENRVFKASAADLAGNTPQSTEQASPTGSSGTAAVEDGRLRFPAKYRTADGHYVRSRAELSIDNWLYMQGIVHAYERKLPIEEDAYCDFYLPEKKVFIEYWGMEKDPRYSARKAEKQALYAKHGLNLVELSDPELENLDDNLARLLIAFGVSCT